MLLRELEQDVVAVVVAVVVVAVVVTVVAVEIAAAAEIINLVYELEEILFKIQNNIYSNYNSPS